jgi:TetR/AcrR family transcriptional regulator
MTADARKRQVVDVTLDLIGEYGLRGTTMSRIAEGAGIRQASLYTHFDSRRDILLAALDEVYKKIHASRETVTDENSLGRLREMCDHHLELWAAQGERHHAHLLLEFVAGARSEGLAEVLAEKHLRSLEQFTQVVEDGKREGKIPPYVDPAQVSWLITGWAFAGDVAHQMGFESFFDPSIVVHWLDVIFESFAAPPSGESPAAEAACATLP